MAEPLALLWLVASSPEVQIDPAALELELVHLALAVVLAARLEREQFGISRQLLQFSQQFSYRHASLLCQAQRLDFCP
jgi:hypothetical protein